MAQIAGKLAAKIIEAIKADGRSLYALGEAASVSRKQLGLFMRGESDMTLTVAARLCEVLGLELTERKKDRKSNRPAN